MPERVADPTHAQRRLEFGPFQVDVPARELFKEGVRIRLPGQPFEILLVLLSRPGEVVTREELRNQIWNDGTFIDFEHGLNAAMNKLRKALIDSAEKPRYIETVPGRGYRFIGTLRTEPPQTPQAPPKQPLEQPAPSSKHWRWVALGAAVLLLAAGVAWRLWNAPAPEPSWKFSRITSDAGITDSPALSRDGTLLAYSSDRASTGASDLYVQQVAGGEPIRLTSDGFGNTSPDFSPDGTRIVFQSNREGGGIFEIPAFGGEAKLLARMGRDPKYSPDGSEVAYWIGNPGSAQTIPGSGEIWIVPRNGGGARRIGFNFTAARAPIWSPDGKHLLVVGYTSPRAYQWEIDWWLVETKGNGLIKTGAYEAFVAAGLNVGGSAGMPGSSSPVPIVPVPGCWSAGGNGVIFSADSGDASNLYEIRLLPGTGTARGPVRRLTSGTAVEQQPSCVGSDALAFTKIERNRDLWFRRFDLNSGVPLGSLERITQGPARREYPSLSADGRYLAFASDQTGILNIWRSDFTTGKQSSVASSPLTQRYPAVSPSGRSIAYSVYEGGKRFVDVTHFDGVPERVCAGCLRATDWSPDESKLLVFGSDPFQISALDVKSHQQTIVVRHATHNLLYGRYSPDGNWVSFTERTEPNRGRIAIARVNPPNPVSENAWISIAEEGGEDWADWSPDGKTLYFTSARDGHVCLWGRHVDLQLGKPIGQAFPVAHFHDRATYHQSYGGWSAAGGKIVFLLRQDTGNIWIRSRAGKR